MGATVARRKAAATRITRRKSRARTTRRAKAWAKLIVRPGEEFLLECPACGGDIRLIAFITEPGPIRKILTHLGEPLEPPPIAVARGPPTDSDELVQAQDDRDVFQATNRLFCPRSTSTASERCRPQAAKAPGTADWDAVCGDARKTPPQGDARRYGEPSPDGRHAQSRCSRTVRQPEDRCGSAIDRAPRRVSQGSLV